LDTPKDLEHVWSVEILHPVSLLPLTESEEKLLSGGSVNSEITKRLTGAGRTDRRTSHSNTGGNRGGRNSNTSGSRDFEEGFRKFINKVQTTDERPIWAYPNNAAAGAYQAGAGHFDQGVYRYQKPAGAPGGAPALEDPADVLWFYRDPQGNIQGPFTGADMHEWYKAGFFTAQLLVKREADADFQPLGVLVQVLGNDEEPFLMPAPGSRRPAVPAGMSAAEYEAYMAAQAGYSLFDGSSWNTGAEPEYVTTADYVDPEKLKENRQRLVGVLQQRAGQPTVEEAQGWSKNGQPGPVPKSLKEIQEEEMRRKVGSA